MTPPASAALGDAAVAYAAAGYEVVPLRGKLPHANCPACEPRTPGYRPHPPADCPHELCHGLYAATSDPDRVAGWWARWPTANIGARVPRSLFVLDVDPRAGGLDSLARLEADHGRLPPTRTSLSGRGDGGQHRWYRHPGGPLSVAALRQHGYRGLDLKTHRGYVLLPPSRHPATGQPYTWAEPILDPADPPAWLCRLLAPPAAPAPAQRPLPRPGRGGSVAEGFNAQTSWAEVLGPHGWTSSDPNPDSNGARWRHPGASNPKSATVRHGLLFVYSQATPFEATEPGKPHGYTRFRAYALLEHGGDLAVAARALRAEARR
jgi:Bifunctional DNA primase/polymerase, N-terminal